MITVQKVASNVQRVSASLQTFIDRPNCVLEDRVQYSTVHIPNVFCDNHLPIINYVRIIRIHWNCTVSVRSQRLFHHTYLTLYSLDRQKSQIWRPLFYRMKEGEEKRFEIKLYYEISPLLYKNPKIPNQTVLIIRSTDGCINSPTTASIWWSIERTSTTRRKSQL